MLGAIAGDCIVLNAISCGLVAAKLIDAEFEAFFFSNCWTDDGGVTGTSLISTPLLVVVQMSLRRRFLSFLSIRFDCRFCGAFGSKIFLLASVISSMCVEEWLNGDPGSDESLVACESMLIVMTPLSKSRRRWCGGGWMCWGECAQRKRRNKKKKERKKFQSHVSLSETFLACLFSCTYTNTEIKNQKKKSRQIRRVLLNY